MTDPLDYELPATIVQAGEDPTEHRADDLYKKWFRTKTVAGFISIRPWVEALKVSVDIGELDVQSNKIKSHTLVWVDIIQFLAWLSETVDQRGNSFMVYGGARVDGKPISRVFSVNQHEGAYFWRTEHFTAKESATGAFVPNTDQKISSNQIKMRASEMAEVRIRLHCLLTGYAAQNPRWYVTRGK